MSYGRLPPVCSIDRHSSAQLCYLGSYHWLGGSSEQGHISGCWQVGTGLTDFASRCRKGRVGGGAWGGLGLFVSDMF